MQVTSMTGTHVTNQCKLVLCEYGWSDTLISDNGPCYTSQAFTSVRHSVLTILPVLHTTHSLMD